MYTKLHVHPMENEFNWSNKYLMGKVDIYTIHTTDWRNSDIFFRKIFFVTCLCKNLGACKSVAFLMVLSIYVSLCQRSFYSFMSESVIVPVSMSKPRKTDKCVFDDNWKISFGISS